MKWKCHVHCAERQWDIGCMVTPEQKYLIQWLDSGVDIEAGRISNSGLKPFCKKYKNSQNSICQTLYNAQQNGQTWVLKSNMSASLMSSHHVHSDSTNN